MAAIGVGSVSLSSLTLPSSASARSHQVEGLIQDVAREDHLFNCDHSQSVQSGNGKWKSLDDFDQAVIAATCDVIVRFIITDADCPHVTELRDALTRSSWSPKHHTGNEISCAKQWRKFL